MVRNMMARAMNKSTECCRFTNCRLVSTKGETREKATQLLPLKAYLYIIYFLGKLETSIDNIHVTVILKKQLLIVASEACGSH